MVALSFGRARCYNHWWINGGRKMEVDMNNDLGIDPAEPSVGDVAWIGE